MTGAARSGLAYRPEIDGLRAIAVVAVILCHAKIPGFRTGFLGVDLFFVISGYLITGVLAADLAQGRFSILRFYERRIRRIIPALMLVMLLCIPFAVWLMLPDDLENFGQSLVGTTLFANNILLFLTSGYFEMEVQFKPLMHSWSLGVEEQYYLVVPLLMGLAWRLGKARGLLIGVVAVTALSFAACLFLARAAPVADFFLIVSRGWELGAGALAMLLEPRIRPLADRRTAARLALAGLALAVIPLVLPVTNLSPDARTLVPVLGVCLILLFGGQAGPAGKLLSSRPFVAVGLMSYSAYLFQQPVFAFVRIVSLDEPAHALMAALIVPIFVCAWASWRFVEQPCRDRNRVSTRALLAGSAAAALVVLAAGLTFHFTSGFYRNWPELAGGESGRSANIAYNESARRFTKVQLPEAGGKVRLLVIGDSFAADFINMANETGRVGGYVIKLAPIAVCARLKPGLVEQAHRADFIVLAYRFKPKDVRCIVQRVTRLQGETSAKIIIIGRKSFGYNNNAVMQLPESQRWTWRVAPQPEALEANEAARRALPSTLYVDVIGMLADAQGRVPVFTPDRKFISQDREHLTRPGAIYVGGILFRHPALAALLAAGNPKPADPR
ncbi:acyltransferase [Sphingomonas sp. LB-2]|uniref:acyltransferase family protein n=1 Tax=Sphingomonas caeni TaxID=2984949 RepID=UPI00222F9C1E|nr:acyltransferase [Sphingomonas caeni]MCW3848193.1 acyltransferase [Sphingomonas caeni]